MISNCKLFIALIVLASSLTPSVNAAVVPALLVRQDSPVTLNALPTPSLLVITVTDPAVTTTVTEPAPAAVTVTVTESTPAQAPPQSPVVSSSPAANTDANPKICQQANVDCNGV